MRARKRDFVITGRSRPNRHRSETLEFDVQFRRQHCFRGTAVKVGETYVLEEITKWQPAGSWQRRLFSAFRIPDDRSPYRDRLGREDAELPE